MRITKYTVTVDGKVPMAFGGSLHKNLKQRGVCDHLQQHTPLFRPIGKLHKNFTAILCILPLYTIP